MLGLRSRKLTCQRCQLRKDDLPVEDVVSEVGAIDFLQSSAADSEQRSHLVTNT